ncbi:MAG: YmdB family metallophosphoesterase [Deltaproteobacteria bacterium]|nr:YmdB family metallophosphoesterase [Deltaproteobacteria bacterium]
MKILCLGDVVGRPGRRALTKCVRGLRQKHALNLVIANGENASGGLGFDAESAREIQEAGVDLITLGDHTWQRSGIGDFLSRNKHWCVRPANYPSGAPGSGWLVHQLGSLTIGLFNVLGRVYMTSPLDCPFRAADEILNGPLANCHIKICDAHAGATSEKVALGRYLDGRASLVFGTHTHVQTADEQILPGGTAFISDVGMCGARNSVIGMATDVALARFLTGMHHSYRIGTGAAQLNGVVTTFDAKSGKALAIERVQEIVPVEET